MLMSIGSWALRGYGMWACERIDDDVFIGSVGVFHPLDWPEPEIAYSLDQPFWPLPPGVRTPGYSTTSSGAASCSTTHERALECRASAMSDLEVTIAHVKCA